MSIMSYTVKFKSFEWSTQLPAEHCSRKSTVFKLNGSECFFRLALEKSDIWYYKLYVKLKEWQRPRWKCRVKLLVSYKYGKDLLDEDEFTLSGYGSKVIWFSTQEEVISNDNYPDPKYPNPLDFLFTFDEECEYSWTNKETVDQNVDVSVEGLSKDFSQLLEEGLDHDAEIKCGERSIKTHKLVLSARSDVFRAMLQYNMNEGRSAVVEIQDMHACYLQDFVKYLYTDAMPPLNVEKAMMLYEVGDNYAIKSLMLRCADYLYLNLSVENAYQCFSLANAHSDQELKDKVITFMVQKKMYLQGNDWELFTEQFPKEALKVYKIVHGK